VGLFVYAGDMPIESYDRQLLAPAANSPLWRFMPLVFFQDFMANEELYLRRCDKYAKDDPFDGIPSDEYISRQRGLRRGHPETERTLDAEQGSNRLFTEMFYLSCWNLYKPEHEMQMWQGYAPQGVAVKTTFGRLRAAVDKFPDRMFMGVVRYGDENMTGDNISQALFTKRPKFHWENEVRIALWMPDPKGGQAWNYDENNVPHRHALDIYKDMRHSWAHEYKRRRFLLKDVITGIVISPWAPPEVIKEVTEEWGTVMDLKVPVDPHVRSSLIPSIEDFARHGIGQFPPKPTTPTT
jgi:hypothetical protein